MMRSLSTNAYMVNGLLNLRNVLDVPHSQIIAGLQIDLTALGNLTARAVRTIYTTITMMTLSINKMKREIAVLGYGRCDYWWPH